MDIEKLLDIKKDFFTELEKYVKNNNYAAAYILLNNTEPPLEWFIKEKSEINGKEYYYMPIELGEALMEKIFGGYEDAKIENNIINGGGIYSVITNILITYGFNGQKKHKAGTSAVTIKEISVNAETKISAIEQLQLAIPLSLVKARINVIKNVCKMTGRDVNRFSDEVDENKIKKTLAFLNPE